MALAGKTPAEIYAGRRVRRRRYETRHKWPKRPGRVESGGNRVQLSVSYIESRKHLPVIELRRAA